jgi:hypothetical protein
MVPLYIARVANLRVGTMVGVTCQKWGHIAEVPALTLRERLDRARADRRRPGSGGTPLAQEQTFTSSHSCPDVAVLIENLIGECEN